MTTHHIIKTTAVTHTHGGTVLVCIADNDMALTVPQEAFAAVTSSLYGIIDLDLAIADSTAAIAKMEYRSHSIIDGEVDGTPTYAIVNDTDTYLLPAEDLAKVVA